MLQFVLQKILACFQLSQFLLDAGCRRAPAHYPLSPLGNLNYIGLQCLSLSCFVAQGGLLAEPTSVLGMTGVMVQNNSGYKKGKICSSIGSAGLGPARDFCIQWAFCSSLLIKPQSLPITMGVDSQEATGALTWPSYPPVVSFI